MGKARWAVVVAMPCLVVAAVVVVYLKAGLAVETLLPFTNGALDLAPKKWTPC